MENLAVCLTIALCLKSLLCNGKAIDKMIYDAAVDVNSLDLVANVTTKTLRLEYDILLKLEDYVEKQEDIFNELSKKRSKRKAVKSMNKRWPGNVIPYTITDDFSADDQAQIKMAVDEWNKYTCLNMRAATSADVNHIRFQNGAGCSSYIGMIGGAQEVNLASRCRVKKVIVHELGHAIGFYHEQSRNDRDTYVDIVKENIPNAVAFNFDRLPASQENNYQVEYDYRSIMHYSSKAFSTNDMITVRTKDPQYQDVIGKAEGLSFRDIKLANLMYSCNAHCSPQISCSGEGFQGKNCQCYCPSGDPKNPLRICGSVTGTTTPRQPTTTTQQSDENNNQNNNDECENMHRYCEFWANRGHCDNSPGFMNLYCKRACGQCTAPLQSCVDYGLHCQFWKQQGYCDINTMKYMQRNCRKTCGLCSLTGGNAEELRSASGQGAIYPKPIIYYLTITFAMILRFLYK